MDYSSTLHELFETEVKKAPQKHALIFNKQILTYKQLNQRANQLAHYLRYVGIKPDMPVIVCMERSFEFFIAIIGILKAGGAYIPLDPTHPEERLLFITNESAARVVLTTPTHQKNFIHYSGTVLLVDDIHIMQQAKDNPEPRAQGKNLAYAIYTSGSTGTPKGVLIEHQSALNYAAWFAKECINEAKDRIDCSSNPAFDFAITLTIVPLMLGLTLVICEEAVKKDPRRYIEYLQSNAISLIKITPSYFRVLLYEIQNKKILLPRLKKIMLGGENLATIDCRHWLERYPHHRLYNEYGPTETSVAVSLFIVDRHNVAQLGDTVPIGYFIPNGHYYIVNEAGTLAAAGESGELYVGGICVARGYLNNATLTEHYFIANPFDQTRPGNLYKTGDLCRLNSSAALECIGRIDHQLKIRGFRVELEEIEQCLMTHTTIKTAVVIATDKLAREKRLIAYYLLKEPSQSIDPHELRAYLKRFLPDYMIPLLFVKIDSLPLNANEKLDRSALPLPQGPVNDDYKAPKKLLEKKIASIWATELGMEGIGLDDNFFELGGHSLSAARVISKINHQFKKEINLQSFYQAPTIASLAVLLKKTKKIEPLDNTMQQIMTKGTLPLSDFQLMLWLTDTFEPKAKKLNIFTRKRLKGRLDLTRLNHAFAALLQRHSILSYRVSKFHPNHYLQKYHGYKIVEKNLTLLTEQEGELIVEESFQELKEYYPWPKNKPQIITRLFYLKDETTELQISMPHLIADDVCPEILLNDLSFFYQESIKKEPEEQNIYKDYIVQEQHYFKTHLQEDINFWHDYLKDAHLFSIPSPYIIASMPHNLPFSTYASLSEEQVHHFKEYCAHHHISILDGLCAVLMLALQRHTGDQNLVHPICLNRVKSTRDCEDYDQTIGCFLRLEPIKLKLNKEVSLSSLAQEIHEQVMDTAPFQKCSNLAKLASLATFRQKKNHLKEYAIKLGVWLYSLVTRAKVNRTILNLTGRLSSAKGCNFLINVNMQNNFLNSIHRNIKHSIFGLPLQAIKEKQSDLLRINNLLDVCFLRMEDIPYIVLSANLSPLFKEQILREMVQIIEYSIKQDNLVSS